jgi:hypothetical protein
MAMSDVSKWYCRGCGDYIVTTWAAIEHAIRCDEQDIYPHSEVDA